MQHYQPDSTLPIVIVGAGIVGLTTAYALTKKGCRVTVIDKLAGPAEMCSRANAGIIAVGHAHAWAEPKAIVSIFRALMGREPAVRITKLLDPKLWQWGLSFLRHCTPSAHLANSAKLLRLSLLSSELLASIETEMQLPQEIRHQGGLYLYKNARQFEQQLAALEGDASLQTLDTQQLIAYEPWLAGMQDQLVGGLLSSADGVGDCYQFSKRCYQHLAQSSKVEFLFNTTVTGFEQRASQLTAVRSSAGDIPCQQVVLASGIETADITSTLGFKPLIYPVKGYSGSWEILHDTHIPKIPFVDESEFLAVGSYGGILRVTATAEFAGRDASLAEERLAVVKNYVQRYMGDAVDLKSPQFWTGMRPTTPAGAPYLGRVKHLDNLWLNAGHGQLGWTMSMGCAQTIAQLISGEQTGLSDVSIRAPWLVAA